MENVKKTSQSRIRMTRSRILMVIQCIAAEVLRMVATHLQCDCRTFQINVELCSSVKSIKYICKYVNKGSDLAIFEVQNINKNDEIARYQMGRYISSNEAIWHILSFPIHERDPAVQHLAIHLENGQRVYFTEENVLQRAFEAPKTTLTEFFTLCQKPDVFGQFAKTLVYGDVPRYFTWNKSSKKWKPRKQGKPHPSITGIFKAKTLGRLYTVHPKQLECFYLRLLLVNVPGPTSFEFLRTVNGRVFNTYQDECRELQLLEDDNHWDLTLADAALTSTPNNIRQLFAIILTTCYPSQAQTLWEKYKNCMTEDILHRMRQKNQCQNIDYTPEIYNEALVFIEDLCVLISNLPLNYGMPSPNRPATDLVNTDLQREKPYDHGSLATIIMNSEPLLTAEQKIIHDRIMLAVAAEQGGFFFLDAPGGTEEEGRAPRSASLGDTPRLYEALNQESLQNFENHPEEVGHLSEQLESTMDEAAGGMDLPLGPPRGRSSTLPR
ncbi:uncharacterized protein LOC122756458 [Drosophila santomea]|uniref:uncharacterized protein LOC122756458 n=2 Tax=Drosophila santomea TaxID=129105 RepID=UPI001CCAB101|nr:uncharacterized protein LOC122756458 [Drosophila santomea]